MTWRSTLMASGSRLRGAGAVWLDEVPLGPPRVGKDGDGSVRLAARRFKKPHAARRQRVIVPVEVVRLKKIPDPAAGLIADPRPLPVVARDGEHDARARAPRRRDDDPPFAVGKGRVLDDREAERVAKERETLVISTGREG